MTPSVQRCVHSPLRENSDTADFLPGLSLTGPRGERQLYWNASAPTAGVTKLFEPKNYLMATESNEG